ncbi:MAG: response regulator transcription factor [Acidobacteriia bacterium]|nr:response regulator transcription factor [Terriglobia bacterium]MYC68277.1 response regulator transcription factor [Terriglobia bacterium]
MPPKVAVIEDDRDLTGLLQYALEQEGFEFACIHDGLAATDFCQRVQPDAIVLDVMLPGLDGFSVCKELRQDPTLRDIPIVFLTARTEEADRLRGLEIGGDDYVVKPFSVRELVARLKLRLRSSRVLDSPARVGDLELDRDRREVRVEGRTIPVTTTEFQILERMLRQPGRVWSRAALLQAVWGLACHVTDRTVDVHIRRLRSKLEADPSNPQYIHSVRGFGYTLRDPSEGSSNLNGSAART